ncbi:MAG: phenylalanine--tRNA ligase subunit beta [Nitrososphaeria archaeon]|nr:phenylalanine--tRNA ligase subunit beta [Nitrososphaeria archaeon]NDB45778.1 phenylalanine--tRNA ligase subunit beta [Nitrososphaeria archaeon]NDB90276.1 phenylalanine--tRNA ligase subunit beta [Nitrososphaerota archaeon]NDF26127.1 phenylalanine--tRNA ligase subunit beta [Nitrosopumilaceae archaeon]NDF46889.1 phenylalanine--tRNA ligase subunit beta [Nitrosopumilaceae archaeon]
MPVVTLYLSRLQKLVGKVSKDKIISALPFLGLDIEEETDQYIRVEYSPNRPDYATDVGIATGLQGLLGIKKGIAKIIIKRQKDKTYSIKTSPAVKKIRPFVLGLVAKDGKLDDEIIRQLIALQEDLHFGVGRKRKKASIGIHDLDKITLPLLYTAKSKDHKFVPLATNHSMSVTQILDTLETGKEYSAILGNGANVPMILDSKENTVSFPPIINSALTTVSTSTKNLLVEVTGNDPGAVADTLAVVASALQGLGFTLHDFKTDSKSSADSIKMRTIILDPNLVSQTLGLELSPVQICNMLKKCRLDAMVKNKKISCTVPSYRFDIFGPMDLVEEVALGYGIQNLSTTLPSSTSVGQKSKTTLKLDQLSQIMLGLGFTEALNSSLTSKQTLYDNTKRDSSKLIEVAESKSQEHTVLRDSIIPGLLENLSKNIHEQYPQKLFESGIVFSTGSPIKESICLACVSAHKDSGYTEIKSILQSLLKTDSNIECQTKTSQNTMFAKGKTADVIVNNKKIGIIGEIDSGVIENFKIRVPVSGFELILTDFLL